MQKIEQRIERLEQQQATPEHDTVTAIVLVSLLAPGQVPAPVAGWGFTDGQGQSQRVMCLHGETDAQFQERAIATARTAGAGGVLLFNQISRDEVVRHECRDIEQAA